MTQRAFRVIEGGRRPAAAPPVLPTRPATWLARVWAGLVLVGEVRRGRRHLAGMEPRLLADIGASRADAWVETARHWWDTGPPPPDATRRRAR